ncbi:MAG: winged helix-turn-helix transcriptional regulator [Candidatus Verstraetearchaeota archaeon]|nr:winged helix-turn-helix transcriptional regulator [Candidatus Verstraetearchaeota archaeon]
MQVPNLQILREQGELTRLLILLEVMRNQPHVTQREISDALGITIQAVCKHFSSMMDEGLLEAGVGRANYRLTAKAYQRLRSYLKNLEACVATVKTSLKTGSIIPAIAEAPVKAGEKVKLVMKAGVLCASPVDDPVLDASGTALDDACVGEEVRVTDLQGKVMVNPGRILFVRLPSANEGGSRAVDIAKVRRLMESFKPDRIGVIGVVGRAVLNKIGRGPDFEFGVTRAATIAASRGLCVMVLGVGRVITRLIEEIDLESAKHETRIIYEVYDVSNSNNHYSGPSGS